MGEIKSTLDIIMEKTEGMTMSDEERKEMKKKELSDRARGLIRKFIDGILTYEDLKEKLSRNNEGEKELMLCAVAESLFSMLVPGENNDPILRVLDIFKEIDVRYVEEILLEAEQKIEKEKNIYRDNMRRELRDRGISGTAVIPNPNAETKWIQRVESINKEFREKLTGISQHL